MGAGRSGTTMLATLLGEHKEITTLGEMHQFLDHIIENKECSCGLKLSECEEWRGVLFDVEKKFSNKELQRINEQNSKLEFHSNFLNALSKSDKEYEKFQVELGAIIERQNENKFYLDSSKYASRALLLNRVWDMDFKVIYVVRDLRGVINSFSKQVQSPKGAYSTIVYYLLINFIAEIASIALGKKKVLKIRYEDYVKGYDEELKKIGTFLSLNMDEVIQKLDKEGDFYVPHIIGGNRLKKNKKVKLTMDNEWLKKTPILLRYVSYLMALPFMLINRYRI